jgi:cytochrome c
MSIRPERIISIIAAILLSFTIAAPLTAEEATRDEIIAKVKEAAALIAQSGSEAAFEVINDKGSPFTWKGTYVFVIDFDGVMLARSFKTEAVVGKNWIKFKDKSDPPKFPIKEMVDLAKSKGEGWTEYMYAKPGGEEGRFYKKVSYIYRVPGHEMFTAAGIYE